MQMIIRAKAKLSHSSRHSNFKAKVNSLNYATRKIDLIETLSFFFENYLLILKKRNFHLEVDRSIRFSNNNSFSIRTIATVRKEAL